MTTYTGPLVHAVTGHAAGEPSKALASGAVASGVVAFVTGEDVLASGVLVEVSFDVDDILSATFSVTQTTGTGLGSSLSNTSVTSTSTGFTINISTAAAVANTLYVYTWT